jgi:hypothetical protein
MKPFIHQCFRGWLVVLIFLFVQNVNAGKKKFSIVEGNFCLETPRKKFFSYKMI